MVDAFYKGKKVLITGDSGFKGSWLTFMLLMAGAEVTGYALKPPTNPSLFELLELKKQIRHIEGDIRDLDSIVSVFGEAKPDIVFHLAAQPIVRESYKQPVYTYQTNVMGTVNICEAVRLSSTVRSFLNVTTDKVYENSDVPREQGFKENEPLDGYDPYSNSKSCSELVTHSYKNSFFDELGIAVSTARAGNVIGGGDFAKDRIIPDSVRAVEKGETIIVRNAESTRPYQHVLEPLNAYMLIAEEQYKNIGLAGYYNVGPDDENCVKTGELVDLFCKKWGKGASWEERSGGGPHEAAFLKLDSGLIKEKFGWKPLWDIDKAVERVVDFEKERLYNPDGLMLEAEKEVLEYYRDKLGK